MTDWSSAKSSHTLVPAVTVRFVSCWARSPAVTTVTWISDTGLLLVVADDGDARRNDRTPICRSIVSAARHGPPPGLRRHRSCGVGEAGLDSCETRELFTLERLGEQVALAEVAPGSDEFDELAFGLDALADGLEAAASGDQSHRRYQQCVATGVERGDETAVDLEDVEGDVGKGDERRITGAEIIHDQPGSQAT